jgi:hypothetical protein
LAARLGTKCAERQSTHEPVQPNYRRSQGRASFLHMDYAGAVAVYRGECFRFIYDEHGKPTKCPEPPIATGWLQVGPKWHEVDSCSEHSAQLRRRGPYRAATGVRASPGSDN